MFIICPPPSFLPHNSLKGSINGAQKSRMTHQYKISQAEGWLWKPGVKRKNNDKRVGKAEQGHCVKSWSY